MVHSVATSSPPFLLRPSPAWLPPHSSTEITLASVIGDLCPAQSHVCPHLSASQPSFLKHFFFWLPRCHPLLVPSYLSGLLSVSFAASSIFTSHSLASWGFSRGPSSLENFCLIMEVRSHRTLFRSFPSHSGQIMKACLRPGPSTCLSLPPPPPPHAPCSSHMAPLLLLKQTKHASAQVLCTFRSACSSTSCPVHGWLRKDRNPFGPEAFPTPVSPHPSAFVKCLTLFITQQIVRSMRMGDILRFVHCCVAPSPAQKSTQ